MDRIYSFSPLGIIKIVGVTNQRGVKVYENGICSTYTPDSTFVLGINELTKNKNGKIIINTVTSDSMFFHTINYPLQLEKKNFYFDDPFISSTNTIAIDGDNFWTYDYDYDRLFKSSDSIFHHILTNLDIEFKERIQNGIEVSDSKIFFSLEDGIAFIDKRLEPFDASMNFDLNQISTVVSNTDPLFSNIDEGLANFEFPKGSGNHGYFVSSFITVAKESVSQKFVQHPTSPFPRQVDIGPINNTSGLSKVYMAKVSQSEINTHKQSFNSPAYSMPDGIKKWPANGDSTLCMASDLAPFYDANNNGCYDPQKGDYPIIKGDEALYWINHSADPDVPFEYHYMMYAFDSNKGKELNQSLFVQFRLINRGTFSYDSVITGLFQDGDLGFPGDDYVGCDSVNNISYYYNGDNFDDPFIQQQGFGSNTPALGVKFLRDSMMTFSYRNFGGGQNGDPIQIQNWLIGLTGINPNGPPIHPNSSKYGYTGNPFLRTGNTELTPFGEPANAPGDRRTISGLSPYTLAPGESKTIEVVFGYGRKDSVSIVGENISELIRVLNQAKAVWDTISTPSITYNSSFCPIVIGLEENKTMANNIVNIYPNPSRGFLNLEAGDKIERIEIYSLQGQMITSQSPRTKQTVLSLESYPKGLYLLKILTKSGHWESKKVILK